MKYKGNSKIKALIAAGLIALNASGCKKEIQGYKETSNVTEAYAYEDTLLEIEDFKKKLQEDFLKANVVLDKTSDKFISNITIDGTNVSIELIDASIVSGILENLTMSDITFENFYIYDSQFIDDLYNADEIYRNYREKGYDSPIRELYDDYTNRTKLNVVTDNCFVNNEYKEGNKYQVSWYTKIDYSNCRNLWLQSMDLKENQFSSMPNLETLVLTEPYPYSLKEEVIKIQSNSLKNIIIDGYVALNYIDSFDFTECPNLEIVSIPNDSQETNLNGLKGLKNLKVIAFGLPNNAKYNLREKILGSFQERIDLVSEPFSIDDKSLRYGVTNFISDISGINGTEVEILNITFLNAVNSNMLLETVKSLPNLKQIVGFEINNAGLCSDELIEYCKNHEIQHPFTERSLEIKHKLTEIISNVITEDMNEDEKIKALSEYVINNMEYDWDLADHTDKTTEDTKKGWSECLYHSVIEGRGICVGYTMYAQNLFTEAGIASYKINGLGHVWNLVQIDDEFYFVDLTNVDSEFDEYRWDSYYLVSIDEEWPFYTGILPIEAEEKYEEAKEERNSQRELSKMKLGNYMIQANKHDLRPESYSKFSGIIGILSALDLAKKIDIPINNRYIDSIEPIENREDVIKVENLGQAFSTLKRFQKLDILKNKRDIAEEERIKNKKARELEIEALQINNEENFR